MEEYELIFTNGDVVYILAEDLEDAAWQALHICEEQDDLLIDVCPLNETK